MSFFHTVICNFFSLKVHFFSKNICRFLKNAYFCTRNTKKETMNSFFNTYFYFYFYFNNE